MDLAASSDSGTRDDDNLTNVATATVNVQGAEISTVRIYRGVTLLGEATQVSGVQYRYSFGAGQLTEGDNVITARSYDGLAESQNSPPLIITLDTSTPGISATTLATEGQNVSAVTDRFNLTFTEEMRASTVNDAANLNLRSSGADNAFGTADDQVYVLASTGYGTGLVASYRVTNGPLQPGSYRLQVGAGMTDRAGNPLTPFERRFTVSAVAGYQLEDQDNDFADRADPLTFVEDPAGLKWTAGRGNLSTSGGDVDYWRFTAQAGDVLSIASETPGNAGSTSLRYRVLRPDGSQLLDYRSESNGSGQSSPTTLDVTGTYRVLVNLNNAYEGEYRFRISTANSSSLVLENENNDSRNNAHVIVLQPGAAGHQVGTVAGYVGRSPRDWSLACKAATLVAKLGEHWLWDAIAAVERLQPENRWGYLHRCLDEGAKRLGFKLARELSRIELPSQLMLVDCSEERELSTRLCEPDEDRSDPR